MVALFSPVVGGAATVYVASDWGDVASARYLEIPVSAPGEANTLVIVDGIAIPDLATDENLHTEDTIHLDFLIDTNYKLGDNDLLIDHSAYVCLSSIEADDDQGDGGEFRLALETADVLVGKTSKIVQLKVSGAAGGDTGLHRIGFQLNLLVRREA
jgi:hypothetical protein